MFKIFFKKNIFFVLAFLLIFAGCAPKTVAVSVNTHENTSFGTFKKEFFLPWYDSSEQNESAVLSDMAKNIDGGEWYGENLMPINKKAVARLLQKANDGLKNEVFKNAITVRNADMRVLPTEKPFFKDSRLAGEGYPFDCLQNSRIYISTPLKLLYATPQKDYYFAKSSVGYGWIDARAVAFTDGSFEEAFSSSLLESPRLDKEPLYDEHGFFIERLNIGTVLRESYVPIRDESGKAVWVKHQKLEHSDKLPIALNELSVAFTAYSMYGEPYGWGGYLDNRDCSMFLRDIFVNFGIFLPRNSADQAKGYTDLSAMDKETKKAYIRAHAKAWHTLVYLKGHIMLYVGVSAKGEPLVIQDAWGIKSFEDGKEGRKMLGGVVLTTMEEGKGQAWFDENKSSVLSRVLGIKDIF